MKKKFKSIPSIALLSLLGLSSLHASDAGTTSANFLKIPISARGAAMAGAFAAMTGDATSLEYNPAGLLQINRTDINATYIKHIEDTSFQSVSIGFPIFYGDRNTMARGGPASNKVAVGLQYRLFRADDFARDAALGTKGDEFEIRDQLAQLSLAIPLRPTLTLGLSGKYIGQKIYNESARAYAGDAGLLWHMVPRLNLGVAIQNVGSGIKFIDEEDPLPTQARAGVAYYSPRVIVTFDAIAGRDKVMREALGVEIPLNRFVRVRGGALYHTDPEFTGGLGIQFTGPTKAPAPAPVPRRIQSPKPTLGNTGHPATKQRQGGDFNTVDIGLDYAIQTHNDLDITHTISLKILY